MSKDTSITAEQEAQTRYPLGWGNQQDSINSTLQSGFVEGADWQALKDKQRIEELEDEVTQLHETEGWISVKNAGPGLLFPQPMPGSEIDIKLKNGSIIIGVTPQLDGDFWTRDVTGAELFIDESMVTHYRLLSEPVGN